jgi:hypothetical protein
LQYIPERMCVCVAGEECGGHGNSEEDEGSGCEELNTLVNRMFDEAASSVRERQRVSQARQQLLGKGDGLATKFLLLAARQPDGRKH